MIQTFLQHKLALIGISLLIAGGVWYGLSSSSGPSPDLVTISTSITDNPVEQGIVESLLVLRAVKLEGTILRDQAFLSLRDFSTAIIPEPIGRENPFAPFIPQTIRSTSSTPNTQIFQPRP